MTNNGYPAIVFSSSKSLVFPFFRITLQQHVVQESEPHNNEHVQMRARVKCLMDAKAGNSKSCISSQPRRLAAWFKRLVWHGMGACLNRWGRVLPYGWRTRCFVVLCIFRQRPGFFTLKINCIFGLSMFRHPLFFWRKNVRNCIRICYLQVVFYCTSTWRIFLFLRIVKLWNMNKRVQYDMSCDMILAMLPRVTVVYIYTHLYII